jgi:hypothetical protein
MSGCPVLQPSSLFVPASRSDRGAPRLHRKRRAKAPFGARLDYARLRSIAEMPAADTGRVRRTPEVALRLPWGKYRALAQRLAETLACFSRHVLDTPSSGMPTCAQRPAPTVIWMSHRAQPIDRNLKGSRHSPVRSQWPAPKANCVPFDHRLIARVGEPNAFPI